MFSKLLIKLGLAVRVADAFISRIDKVVDTLDRVIGAIDEKKQKNDRAVEKAYADADFFAAQKYQEREALLSRKARLDRAKRMLQEV